MPKTIYKYQLGAINVQTIKMPQSAQILSLQVQNETPFIWALAEPNSTGVERTFEIFGTGHEMPDGINRKYIGTYQLFNGDLVFHCFERI